jgi:hypothetical protein
MNKRVVSLTAAAIFALGIVPLAASAVPPAHHTEVPVADTGFAVGLQTPDGRTCAYVQTPEGWYSVTVGGGLVPVVPSSGSGRYDPDNSNAAANNNVCDNNWSTGS